MATTVHSRRARAQQRAASEGRAPCKARMVCTDIRCALEFLPIMYAQIVSNPPSTADQRACQHNQKHCFQIQQRIARALSQLLPALQQALANNRRASVSVIMVVSPCDGMGAMNVIWRAGGAWGPATAANLPDPPQKQDNWPAYEAKMKARGLSEAAIGAFKRNFDQLVAGVTGMVRRASRARCARCSFCASS